MILPIVIGLIVATDASAIMIWGTNMSCSSVIFNSFLFLGLGMLLGYYVSENLKKSRHRRKRSRGTKIYTLNYDEWYSRYYK